MKRLILTLATIASLATPMVATTAQAHERDRHEDRWERHDDRQDRHHGNGRWDRREDRRDHRDEHRNRNQGWDRGQHNGYYYNNRWSYGPPPQAYYGQSYYQPGYTAWRRGGVMPSYYRNSYISDYDRYRLRAPPRGYGWYQADNDYLLVAIATGLIFEIISRN